MLRRMGQRCIDVQSILKGTYIVHNIVNLLNRKRRLQTVDLDF